MKVYRIAKKEFIEDLTGEGAWLFGGRWNNKGTRVLYTSVSRSLATVEYLVHVPLQIVPIDLKIAEIDMPDVDYQSIDPDELPAQWQRYPSPTILPEIGEKWLKENKTLYLKVPSAVIAKEWNILINPMHVCFSRVRISSIEEYSFDVRLVNR